MNTYNLTLTWKAIMKERPKLHNLICREETHDEFPNVSLPMPNIKLPTTILNKFYATSLPT